MDNKEKIFFAAVGDVHGHMDIMVSLLKKMEGRLEKEIEFVLQVGDFEPHRDEDDLSTMAAPSKYRKLGDFPNYYKEQLIFPWSIYFIGGNHEPYGFLEQITKGGEVCSNCYYIGRANYQEISNLLVAGLSGIYREDYYSVPRPSFEEIDRKSNKLYSYFNKDDVEFLLTLKQIDILILHEWPSNIIRNEDEKEINSLSKTLSYDSVGNEYSRLVIEFLEPKLVLCGHMHKKYRSQIVTESGKTVNVCCLTNVKQGRDSIALFEYDCDKQIIKEIILP